MARGVGIGGGAHPAGIFSDLSIDGPVIGTLIVVLDRGKNLPNRKTIGKQDPYCVARIGKEAKRTDADKRGGQTPKWDKELRFNVRNSPDYRSLKLTCFNEDKKTELIGETIVKLDKILVQGGGQDDGWRQLNCKGKYAGEIMVELTFWDLREKKEEVKSDSAVKKSGDGEDELDYISGPRVLAGVGQLAAAKREKEKEKRREREREMLREREVQKKALRRALPSDPDLKASEAVVEEKPVKKSEDKREKERESYKKSGRSRHNNTYEEERPREEQREKRTRRPRREIVAAGAGNMDEHVRESRRSRKSLPAPQYYDSSVDLRHMQQHGSSVNLAHIQQHGSSVNLAHIQQHGSSVNLGHMQQHGSSVDLRLQQQQHGSSFDLRLRDPSPAPSRGAMIDPIMIPNGGARYDSYDQYGDEHISGGEMMAMGRHDDGYMDDDGYIPQNGHYMQQSLSQGPPPGQPIYASSPGEFEMDDAPPPPPPPHRHRQSMPVQPLQQLRHQPSQHVLTHQPSQQLRYQPSQHMLTHQPSQQLRHQPSEQFRHQPSQQLRHQPSQQLRHQPSHSGAGWALQTVQRPGQHHRRNSFDFAPPPPLKTHFSNYSSPSLVHEPDFDKLEAPNAPYRDEFDDSGRFSAPGSPRRIAYEPQNGYDSDSPHTPALSFGSNSGSDSGPPPPPQHNGALVPAGYKYNDSPYDRRGSGAGIPDADGYSQALVTTGAHQKPPPPQYPNSRRNSYLGDPPTIKDGIPIPPSLVPGIEPQVAEELRQMLENERRMLKLHGGIPPLSLTGAPLPGATHVPPAPYVEEVNDREDGGRRKSTGPGAKLAGTVAPLAKPRPLSPTKGDIRPPPHSSSTQNSPTQQQSPIDMERTGSSHTASSSAQLDPAVNVPKRLAGTPFSPEAYNTLNPKASTANFKGAKGTIKNQITAKFPVVGSKSRILKPDDILTPESYAPEPERKTLAAPEALNAASGGSMRHKKSSSRVTGARDLALMTSTGGGSTSKRHSYHQQQQSPPEYSSQPPQIPKRESSSRQLLLSGPTGDVAPPPPPPAHQALTIISNRERGDTLSSTSGTQRNKLQKVRPVKSIASFTTQQQQSLQMQIQAHEQRLREREAEEQQQQQQQQQQQLALQQQQQQQQQYYPPTSSGSARHRYSNTLDNYNPNRNSMIAAIPSQQQQQQPPPGYDTNNPDDDERNKGMLVLHRHRSADMGNNGNNSNWDIRPRSAHYDAANNNNNNNTYGSSPNNTSYDQGMVLYRPTGGGGGGYDYTNSSNAQQHQRSTRGRERGGSAPGPPPGRDHYSSNQNQHPLGMSSPNVSSNALATSPGGGGYASSPSGGGGSGYYNHHNHQHQPPYQQQQHQHQQQHQNQPRGTGLPEYDNGNSSGSGKALMSREDWLAEEMRGISIGPSMGSRGTVARRRGAY